jgi:hypothetical protein
LAVQDVSKNGVVAASGIGEIVFQPTSGQSWIAQQLSNYAPNVGGSAVCEVFLDGNFQFILVAQSDTAAGDPPIPMGSSRRLRVRWRSATAGAALQATLWYDDGQG